MSPRLLVVMFAWLTAGTACGGTNTGNEIDAAEIDAEDTPIDAPLETDGPPPPADTVLDLSSAGGRMQAGTLTLDFAIGHGADQQRASGGPFTLDRGAVLTH